MGRLLDLTCEQLGWPARKDIMAPSGTGPGVIAELARRKIGTAIERQHGRVDVGILAANPNSDRTEDPLAIVCDFPERVQEDVLKETHRLTWSFSRSPMLVTVEPSLLRVWTCWRTPQDELGKLKVEEVQTGLFGDNSLSTQVARGLQWVELTSGSFFRNRHYSKYFHRDQRADQLMLNDLKTLRERLLRAKLPEDICHDLLARVIFIEFLFQRKDSQGNAALNEGVLTSLHERGVLSKPHKDLVSILGSHRDTYRFFRELNGKFNGDLFPGNGETDQMREQEWAAEMRHVKQDPHLRLLAELVSGKMEIATGQRCLWRRYAFDAIPLEFISSIYEEFVTRKKNAKAEEEDETPGGGATGAHYTPNHLVDLVLDEVLPWDSNEWDMKVLDPACGSGIFLVKAFQRIVHRWKKANEDRPSVGDLRQLLKNNLFGVDKEPHAVRVASFSLYLAMCDEIEPKLVWQKNVSFPPLRERSLVTSDFFAEDKSGFCTARDQETYDCLVGNAPWGYATETEESKKWARSWGWNIPNGNIGPLFLCKCAHLAKPDGKIAMLQPAGAMLFNRHSTAMAFRRKFFSTYGVEKIVNLSSLRFGLFSKAVSPACVIVMHPGGPLQTPITYDCPKPKRTKEDDYSLVVEPFDSSPVEPEDAATDPWVWTVLAWGGPRDLQLIRKLHQKPYSTIGELAEQGHLRAGNGFKREGKNPEKHLEAMDLPVLESHEIWSSLPRVVDSGQFPPNSDPDFERFRELENYALPLLIMKESWTAGAKRFKGVVVEPASPKANKLLFSQSFNGIRSVGSDGYDVHSIALAINSILAVYYFLLTGARLGSYRPTVLLDDIREFPLPASAEISAAEFAAMTEAAIDKRVKEMYRLNDAEWVLIEDMFRYTLRDFKEGLDSPGRQPTRTAADARGEIGNDPVLREYCEYLARVFRAGFGKEAKVSATIFDEATSPPLPVRLIGIHLDPPPGQPFVSPEMIDSDKLTRRLTELNGKFLESNDPRNGGIFYQRVARIYDTVSMSGRQVPTVFIVKPDQVRYWTRSMALRDADEIAGDIMLWHGASEGK